MLLDFQDLGLAVLGCSFKVAPIYGQPLCAAAAHVSWAHVYLLDRLTAEWVGMGWEGALHCMVLPGVKLIVRGMGGAGSTSPKFGRVCRPRQLQRPCSTQVSTGASRACKRPLSVCSYADRTGSLLSSLFARFPLGWVLLPSGYYGADNLSGLWYHVQDYERGLYCTLWGASARATIWEYRGRCLKLVRVCRAGRLRAATHLRRTSPRAPAARTQTPWTRA